MIRTLFHINEKLSDAINSGLTFLFGGGVGSSLFVVITQTNVDTVLRWGVFVVTIILGILKGYYMIKNEGNGGSKKGG